MDPYGGWTMLDEQRILDFATARINIDTACCPASPSDKVQEKELAL